MTTALLIKEILEYSAAVVGVLSGILWWRAAGAIVIRHSKESTGSYFSDDVDVQATLVKQARLNRYAALCTGLAAGLGGLGAL